jgi:hypothetical protein
MKTILPLVISFAAFNAVAQADKPSPPLATGDIFAPVPGPPTAAAARPAKPARRAEARIPSAPGVMGQTVAPPPAPEKPGGGFGGGGSSVTVKRDKVLLDGDNYIPRSAKTGRTLVVQTSEPDSTGMANTEEDLSVMALILLKATGNSRSDDKRMAMGIEVFGSSSGARNIYVEGYGALFLLGVRFPLIAPPEPADETKAKQEEDSDWAEARAEFLQGERSSFELHVERVWESVSQLKGGRGATEDYDSGKVEDLKLELLQALKNATHIRALKPEEYVTVVIQGAEAARTDKIVTRSGGNVNVIVTSSSKRNDSKRGETVMTIRVKKSDVDALASGSLDLAGFRKKAAIQTYFRRGESSVATSPFLAPTR